MTIINFTVEERALSFNEVKNEIDAIQIDTSHLDFVNNTADYQQVLNLLQPLIGEIIHDK